MQLIRRTILVLMLAVMPVIAADPPFLIFNGQLQSDLNFGGFSPTNIAESWWDFTNQVNQATNGLYVPLHAEDEALWAAINGITNASGTNITAEFVTNAANHRIGISNETIRAEMATYAPTNAPTIYDGTFVGSNWLANVYTEKAHADEFWGVLISGNGVVWADEYYNTIAEYNTNTAALTFAVPIAGDASLLANGNASTFFTNGMIPPARLGTNTGWLRSDQGFRELAANDINTALTYTAANAASLNAQYLFGLVPLDSLAGIGTNNMSAAAHEFYAGDGNVTSNQIYSVGLLGNDIDGTAADANKVMPADNGIWLSTRAADFPLGRYTWDGVNMRVVFDVPLIFDGSLVTNVVAKTLTNNLAWIGDDGKAQLNDGEVTIGTAGDGVVTAAEFRGGLRRQDITNALSGDITNNTTGWSGNSTNSITAESAALATAAYMLRVTDTVVMEDFYSGADLLTLEADGLHALTNIFGTKFSASDGFYGPVKPADNAAWLKTAAADFTLARYLWDGVNKLVMFDAPVGGLKLSLFDGEGDDTIVLDGDLATVVASGGFDGPLDAGDLLSGTVALARLSGITSNELAAATDTIYRQDSNAVVTGSGSISVSPSTTGQVTTYAVSYTGGAATFDIDDTHATTSGQTITNVTWTIADGQMQAVRYTYLGVGPTPASDRLWADVIAVFTRSGSTITRQEITDIANSGAAIHMNAIVIDSSTIGLETSGQTGDWDWIVWGTVRSKTR